MRILAAGDSFTYGDGLMDRTKAFPYLVAKKFNAEVINVGQPSLSNQGIMREVIDNFNNNIDLVLVGFTSPGRMELADEDGTYSIWSGRYRIPITPLHKTRMEILKLFSLKPNDKWLLSNFYRTALVLESFLLQRKCQFLFYCLDNYNDHYFKNYPEVTQEYCCKFISLNTNMIFDHEKTIAHWMEDNRLPCGHPNERGHQLIAEKLYEHCRNICGLS